MKLYQQCHILKILLVTDHFWQLSEILNLTKASKWHNSHLSLSLLTIRFWFSSLKFSKLQIFSEMKAFSKYNFCERLLAKNEVFPHQARVCKGYFRWTINSKVQIILDWNCAFCPLILRWTTGKKNLEILRWWVTDSIFFG